MRASRCATHSFGSLREASIKHGEHLGPEDGLLDVEKASRRRSPLRAQEVQGVLGTLAGSGSRVGAEILLHPELPVGLTAWHVRPHVEGEDVPSSNVGQVELLLVAQGIAFLPQEVQKEGEARVVLVRKREI